MAYLYPFASVYDKFTENVDYRQRAVYIKELFAQCGVFGGTVLDAACGTGSLTKEFADMGFEAVGADISPDMLAAAREKLSCCGGRVLLICQDIRKLDLYGTVDCAVCALDSVNHLLTKADVEAAFRSIGLFIRPGGAFVFDVNTLFKHKNVLSGSCFVYENGSSFLVWQNSECTQNGTVDIMLDIFTQDSSGRYIRSSEDFSERAYSVDFLIGALRGSGFDNIRVFGDLSRQAAAENDERIYFAAVKK